MTEDKKHCGLSSFLPMSCRGRAEAFARRLHSRLRSLGSQDDSNTCASENSWLSTSEISNPSVTNLQPRHSADNEIFMDFGMDFDTPGSPEEEVTESELTKLITNPKDHLHLTNLDKCDCMKIIGNGQRGKRNSVDSDSSEGTFFDPENLDIDTNCMLGNQINGISSGPSTASASEDKVIHTEDTRNVTLVPSSSECTISSLSRSEDEHTPSLYEDSLTDILSEEEIKRFTPATESQSTSGWKLSYDPKNNCNNNVFGAIDLESLTRKNAHHHGEENTNSIDNNLTKGKINKSNKEKWINDKVNQEVVTNIEDVATIDKDNTKTIHCNEEINILNNFDEEEHKVIDNVEDTLTIHDANTKLNNEESRAGYTEEKNTITDNEDAEERDIINGECEVDEDISDNKESEVSLYVRQCSIEAEEESYCSHLNIQQNLTVECLNSTLCSIPKVEICTLEINNLCNNDIQEESTVPNEIGKIEITNNLKVSTSENETEDNELEERLPRVRRCSSLKTGKTPPGTPGRKKIVRFADVLGLDLADVRTFMDDIPKIPTSAYDDLSDVDFSLSLSDTSLSSSSPPMNGLQMPTKSLVPLFQQPGGEIDFFDRVRKRQVCLENAVVRDPEAPCVCGTVRVRNLDFNKSVHIRYTIDSWKSFSDLQATYVQNSCDGFSDKFSFTLYVHTLSIGQKLDFAVRFQCKGCQFWDNNDGQNYTIQCLPSCINPTYVPITEPDDRNWGGAAFYYDNSVSLQTTVQEIVTQGLVAKNEKQMSNKMLTAIIALTFACLFVYIQRIVYFTMSS